LRTFRTPGTPLDTTGWETAIVDCFFGSKAAKVQDAGISLNQWSRKMR